MDPSIYSPEEDSYLMSENLKNEIPNILDENPNIKFLEVGCGSGINLQTALESGIKKQNIFSCDLNQIAVQHCKKLGFNSVKSNLFNKISNKKFDLIIFNPPYLPEDKNYSEPKESKVITTAGKKGDEIIIKFLNEAKPFIEENGKIFLITSSLSKKVNFKKLGYKSKIINKQKLFFEELFLHELKIFIKIT